MKEPKKNKKHLVHPNIVGKREVQELYNTMKLCVMKPMPADEVDRLHKLYKTGPYNESYNPEALKRASQEVVDNHTHINCSRGKRQLGTGLGSGKRQIAEEYKKLILELENG